MPKTMLPLFVLGLLSLVGTPAAAENWQVQLQQQTAMKSGEGFANLPAQGFSLLDVPQTELLEADGSTVVSLTLAPGSDYTLLGVCDGDCTDLDLALYQGNEEIVADATTDDWPILKVTPSSSGDYRVKVTMYQCSTATCGYQLSVWSRSATASSGAAESNWQEQLQQQTVLRSGEGFANLPEQGFSLIDVPKTELLAAESASTVSLNLAPGSEYVVLGVCDNDCSDLDLALIKGGIELAKDTEEDDWPYLKVTPTSSPDYDIKVSMHSCSTATCGYQLSIWRR